MAPAAADDGHGQGQRPHAVVVPWPGQGHINPLLHFARQLVSRAGFRITFVNLQYTHAQLMRAQAEGKQGMAPAEEEGMIRFVAVPDGLPLHHQTRTSDVPVLCRALDASASALERLIVDAQPPVTCIVSDSFAMHTQDLANKLRLPRVAVWTQSAASYALHFVAADARSTPATAPCDIIASFSSLPGVPAALQLHDVSTFLQPFDPSDYMFDFVTRPFLRAHEADLVVLNTFDELEGDVLAALQTRFEPHRAPRLRTVGPVESLPGTATDRRSLWPEDYSCLEWLDTQAASSVVYVAFGSITLLSENQLHELSRGLEDCGRPFLWVLRPGTLASGGAQDEDYAAVLPGGYMERVRGRGMVIAWAPQVRVLAHPSVGGFLTHGGWNSVLEGVIHGLPLLGFSYFADQMLNCRCVAEVWQDGLSFDTSDVATRHFSRSDVATKVAAVMDDPHLRQRALSLRDAASRAVAPSGSSSTNIAFCIHVLESYLNKRPAQTKGVPHP